MTAWEYLWHRWNGAPGSDRLDVFGADGWELVVMCARPPIWEAWFKRPKRSRSRTKPARPRGRG